LASLSTGHAAKSLLGQLPTLVAPSLPMAVVGSNLVDRRIRYLCINSTRKHHATLACGL